MSTVSPSGKVSRPRMSSSQSFELCGEMKSLSISTPVLFTRVKSCFPCDASEVVLLGAAGDAAVAGVVEAAAAGFAVLVLTLTVVLPPQAAAPSRAAIAPKSRIRFIDSPDLVLAWGATMTEDVG